MALYFPAIAGKNVNIFTAIGNQRYYLIWVLNTLQILTRVDTLGIRVALYFPAIAGKNVNIFTAIGNQL